MLEGEWWHGSRDPLVEVLPFLHLGTLAQAQMRGGRGCHLTRFRISPGNVTRRRDTGSWKIADLRRARSRGAAFIIYLNRYEGIPHDDFEAARAACRDIDALPDARFRRLIGSAQDSLIVLDPDLVTIMPAEAS